MSSTSATPSKKFSWLKKMDAKIKKSLARGEETSSSEEPKKSKTLTSPNVEIVHKSE